MREAQLTAVERGAAAPRVAAILGAAMLAICMASTPARAPLIAWVAALAANTAIAVALRRRTCAAPVRDSARGVRRATLHALLTGALWAFGLALAQSQADAVQRTLIATLSMSVMSGGALQLALSLPMAYGFIAPVAFGCAVAAYLTPEPAALLVLAAQLVNAGFLALQARFHATELARRTVARFADEVAARRDPLTGLGNRVALREHLTAAFARLAGGGERFALMCFDLEGFQTVNEAFGHRAGDEMILRAAQALRKASRAGDFIARLGGDEFALIAANAPSRAAALALAQDIAAEFRRPYAFAWGESACAVTVGVALAPDHGDDGDHLARSAGAALHKAQQSRRGAIAFVDDAESREARAKREMEAALRSALNNGEMSLEFQPLVDAASGETKGFEALLRWRRPGHAPAPASQFIQAAEASGCIEEIGCWALREATRIAATWPKRLRLAVNISASQLSSPSLAAAIHDIAQAQRFDPRRLELEISESLLIDNFEAAAASLNALRRYGVTIALDNFGTGGSSMAAIARLPLDRIKIDRVFVVDALTNPRCAAVIRAAARLARELGLALTGEGVETEAQFELLRSAGCDEAQGYFFSRPAPPEALPAMFKRSAAAPAWGDLHMGARCDGCALPWCVESGMCRHGTAAR